MSPLFHTGDEGEQARVREKLQQLLEEARATLKHHQSRKTAETLHLMLSTAVQHGLHREAAQIQRALGILATGEKPKLLTQSNRALGDR